ncbi:MAG: DUF4175 family protein [Fibrobacterota bacterium]
MVASGSPVLLSRRLAQLRLRFALAEAASALILWAASLSLLTLLSVSILHLAGPLFSGLGFRLFALLSVCALAACLLVPLRWFFMPVPRLTRRLEALRPEFGSGITGAQELTDDASVLAAAYVATMGQRVTGYRVFDSVRRGRIRTQGFMLAVGAAGCSLFFLMYPGTFREARSLLPALFKMEAAHIPTPDAVHALPVVRVGDITLQYDYPAYTRLPSRIEKNCSGRIRCIKGTVVHWTGRTERPLDKATVVLGSGAAITGKAQGRTLAFSFTILQPDRYEVKGQETAGKEALLFSDSIVCEADEHPSIEIEAAANPMVVRKREAIAFAFRARDDFGLREVNALFLKNGVEQRFKLLDAGDRKSLSEQSGFDLTPLLLAEGDQVLLVLEAVDNDAVSGRKRGHSSPLALTVLDESRAHLEITRALEALMEKMVMLLADHLENGFRAGEDRDRVFMAAATLDARSFEVLQDCGALKGRMESDPQTSAEVFEALDAFLASFGAAVEARKAECNRVAMSGRSVDSLLLLAEEREIGELENILFFLDEAREREKVQNALSDAEDIVRRQKALEEKLKDAASDEKIRALREEFEKLQKDLANLFEKLQKGNKENPLPGEFLNQDAIKSLPKDQLAESLEKIQKALDKKDAEGAMAEMMKLRDLLDQMSGALNNAANQFMQESFAKQAEAMEKAMNELDKMIAQQTKLNEEGDRTLEEVGREAFERKLAQAQALRQEAVQRLFTALLNRLGDVKGLKAGKEGEPALSQMRSLGQATEEARRQYQEKAQDRAVRTLLENRARFERLGQALDGYPDSAQAVRNADSAAGLNEDLLSLLFQRYPGIDKMLSKEQAAAMGKMANQQGGLSRKMNGMAQSLQSMLEGMGPSGKALGESMDGAVSGLGSSFSQLSQYNLPSALPSGKSGLYYMSRLREGLQQSLQQMKQGGGMCGMPGRRGTGRDGRTGLKEGPVEIGKEGEGGKLKQMIKDAIKEKGPEQYDKDNKKYYERLGN